MVTLTSEAIQRSIREKFKLTPITSEEISVNIQGSTFL